ncbi:MAG: PAS domain-containing protein [Methanohalobium sp.]|uniref:PAS domain-containing protein n=1 Tax=Methanohalobium sp. TaxID=2837493 RepID=UPI00397C72CA
MKEDDKSREELLKDLNELQNEITRLKKKEKHLEEFKNIFVEAENLAHLGSWVWDIENDRLTLSSGFQHILGCELEYPVSMNDLLSTAYPDDVSDISKKLKGALDNPDDVEHIVEHRFIHQSTGEIRYLKAYGRLVRNEEDKPA